MDNSMYSVSMLVIRKLRLICRYCDEEKQEKAMSGMSDVNEALVRVVSDIFGQGSKAGNSGMDAKSYQDGAVLLGCLQLALDAMEKKDLKGLSAALGEGIIPEIECALRSGKDTVNVSDEASVRMPSIPCVVCLFGYGDGKFYDALCKAVAPDSTFIVYEPETDTIVDLREQLQENTDFYKLESMQVLATPGYDTLFRTEYVEFMHAVNANRERILVNKNTLRRFKDTASKNVIANLHILKHCNLVGELSHILPRQVPVIIVSAGPSLDGNIELLKRAKGHSLIFAVDTAMKYLMEHDIMPDLGITVEPIKPMANYADDRCFDVPHIFDCEANSEIVGRERGRVFIYNCRDYMRRLLECAGVDVPGTIASGGSVATAAFAVCYMLQQRTVIMIGQDLAYQGTATHAGGVESAGINGDIGYETVDGVNGTPVRTRSDWMGYLRWFENAISMINEQKLDISIIDATEGGALIHGSHVMSLEAAIERFCSSVDYDFAEALKRLPYTISGSELDTVEEKIKQSFAELDNVRIAANRAVKLCDGRLSASRAETADISGTLSELSALRAECESALMYSLINNYAVSDIIDEVNRLRSDTSDPLRDIRQQRLAFTAISAACDYFVSLGTGPLSQM